MDPSDLEAVYRAYIAAENDGDREAMERCLAPDMSVMINGVPELADREADADATDRLLATYPDYFREIRSVYVDAPTVVAEWAMRGSADPARGIPKLDLRGVSIAEVAWSADEDRAVIVSARLYADHSILDRITHAQ